MNKFSKLISFGVFLVLIGVSTMLLLSKEEIGSAQILVFLVFVLVATMLFVYAGLFYDYFAKKHPIIYDFYTKEEKDKANNLFIKRICVGVGLCIFFPICWLLLDVVGISGNFQAGIAMLVLAVGVPILVYGGMQEDKYDLKEYNFENILEDEDKDIDPSAYSAMFDKKEIKNEKRFEAIASVIMLVATGIFLTCGLVFDLWDSAWVVFPIFGIAVACVRVCMYGTD